ncbi:hypothetical protein C7S14_8505 [Burkholderia cepacia]|nr:hypothetical protein C7S14_8505 [Burkholderia cepacia]
MRNRYAGARSASIVRRTDGRCVNASPVASQTLRISNHFIDRYDGGRG